MKSPSGHSTRQDGGAPTIGDFLGGRYRLLQELGSGGMGRVFVALDTELNRRVAVKLIVAAAPEDGALRRFRREARALATFNHPNILAIHDVGAEDDAPYLVCELLEGSSLRTHCASGPLPVVAALDLALQIARGLAAAHGRQIIHRDLKPDNVFITSDGVVKLIDFGIAKLAGIVTVETATDDGVKAHEPAPRATAAGHVVGTAGYMAPEQLRGEPIDERADIFSFGAVLYEILAGRRAFAATGSHATDERALTMEPLPLPKHVPPGVRRIVDRCLRKSAGERPPSAQALIEELTAARRRITPTHSWKRIAGMVCAALVLAASAGAALYGRRSADLGPATVAILPVQSSATGPASTAVLEGELRHAIELVPDIAQVAASASSTIGGRGPDWVLHTLLVDEGPRLRLKARFFAANGAGAGDSVEVVGTASELDAAAHHFGAQVRRQLIRLWADRSRRLRARETTKSRVAEDKLRAYFDLMGPAPRLEFARRGRTLLDEALQADPGYVSALVERSSLLRIVAASGGEAGEDDLRAARVAAQTALRLAPDDGRAALAECLAARHQMRDWPSDEELSAATEACAKAAGADPHSVQALFALAQLHDQSCEDDALHQALEHALARAERYDPDYVQAVTFYLASGAIQRNRVAEADVFSRKLMAQQQEADRYLSLTPESWASPRGDEGAHILRAAVLIRLQRYRDAEAELEEQLVRAAGASGGMNEKMEAACLRGLGSLLHRRGQTLNAIRAARLEEIEARVRAEETRTGGLSGLAGWYAFVAPQAAADWLERNPHQGCGPAVQRAVVFRIAGRDALAAHVLESCQPTEAWAKRCVRGIAKGIANSR